ncbi:MAG: hypothetical protein [Bacteriophage sp.]|nr:MAG: hypothetical protein [Bacteriophage sp.]
MTTWIQIATMACTIITLLYAIHKYNDSRRPLLYIHTDCDVIHEPISRSGSPTIGTKTVVYSVRNIGKRPAKNITIHINPPFISGTTEYCSDTVSILLPEEQHDIYRDFQQNYPDPSPDSPNHKPRKFVLLYKAPGKWFLPYVGLQQIIPADAFAQSTQRQQSGGISSNLRARNIHLHRPTD